MEWKPLLLVLWLGSVAFSASAQVNCPIFQEEPKCGEHEIGLNLFSWVDLDPDNAARHGGVVHYANGLFYKLHCGRNGFRLGVDVFRDNYLIGSSIGKGRDYPTGHAYREGSDSDARFRIGYQRSFGKGDLKPFVGIDVGFRYFREEYDFEGNGDLVYDPSWGSGSTTTQELFIAPLVGLNFRPTEHWSFTIEAALTFLDGSSTRDTSEWSFLFPDERSSSLSQDERGALLDPLRIVAVSYHF